MTQTDYDIQAAARKARERAHRDFYTGKPYANPYSTSDVVHHTYGTEWHRLSRMLEVDMEFENHES